MIYPLTRLPPSVNQMYIARGKSRYKTYDYNCWIAKTMQELKRWPPFYGSKYSCDIRIPMALKTKGDIDNLIKGISDIFVRAKLIPDDRHCMDIRIRYVRETPDNKVLVEFLEVDENIFKKIK